MPKPRYRRRAVAAFTHLTAVAFSTSRTHNNYSSTIHSEVLPGALAKGSQLPSADLPGFAVTTAWHRPATTTRETLRGMKLGSIFLFIFLENLK
jgi:hypothetical protein